TGMEVLTQFNVQNSTTSPTLNINSLGAATIIKSNGVTVQPGDLMGFLDLIYDGSNFRINGLVASDFQRVLPTGTTFYVDRSIGSDTLYDGTIATVSGSHGPWATIQHACNILATYNLNGYSVTIQLGTTGTYSGALNINAPNSGTLIIRGNPASQSSYVISTTPAANFGVVTVGSGAVNLVGLTVQNIAGGATTAGVQVNQANCNLTNVTMSTTATGTLALLYSSGSSQINVQSGCIMAGSATYGWLAAHGGVVTQQANVATSGSPVVTGAFVSAQSLGVVAVGTSGAWIWTGSGATGPRYLAVLNSVVNSQGGGASFFPGSTAGSTA